MRITFFHRGAAGRSRSVGCVAELAPDAGEHGQRRLETLVSSTRRSQVEMSLKNTVRPAEVVDKFHESGMNTDRSLEEDRCYIDVDHAA